MAYRANGSAASSYKKLNRSWRSHRKLPQKVLASADGCNTERQDPGRRCNCSQRRELSRLDRYCSTATIFGCKPPSPHLQLGHQRGQGQVHPAPHPQLSTAKPQPTPRLPQPPPCLRLRRRTFVPRGTAAAAALTCVVLWLLQLWRAVGAAKRAAPSPRVQPPVGGYACCSTGMRT